MNKHGFYTKCVEIEKYQGIVAQRDALLRVKHQAEGISDILSHPGLRDELAAYAEAERKNFK